MHSRSTLLIVPIAWPIHQACHPEWALGNDALKFIYNTSMNIPDKDGSTILN
jgi:hypothetical protein